MPVNNDFLTLTEGSRDIPHNPRDGMQGLRAYMPAGTPRASAAAPDAGTSESHPADSEDAVVLHLEVDIRLVELHIEVVLHTEAVPVAEQVSASVAVPDALPAAVAASDEVQPAIV